MKSPFLRFINATRIQGAILPTIMLSALFDSKADFEKDFSRDLVKAARNFEVARDLLMGRILAEIGLIGKEIEDQAETPNFDMGEELLQKLDSLTFGKF